MNTRLLEARDLTRQTRDGQTLLHPASFSIRQGDRIVCQGKSGAGKTVLLRALTMLDSTGGEVLLRGARVEGSETPGYRTHVMYLPQNPSLPEGTVRDALEEPFSWKANSAQVYDEERALRWLEQLERGPNFLAANTRSLSGGEAQIVAILRNLLLSPSVLLLDEPTSSLDHETTRQLENVLMCWLTNEPDRAFLWVTHDTQQANRLANRRFFLDAGYLEIDA